MPENEGAARRGNAATARRQCPVEGIGLPHGSFLGKALPIRPCGIYAFIDKAQVWLKEPLPEADYAWLQSQCACVSPRWVRARFGRGYCLRLILTQPSREALCFLNTVDGLLLNHAEISLDWTFPDENQLAAAYKFACRFFVKRHHRNQGVRFKWNTRYTGGRWQHSNVVAIYPDKHCKLTGEVLCLHFDWRIYGAAALKQHGINNIGQLADLNLRAFWKKHLVLAAIDPGDLGRAHFNKLHATKRRKPWIVQCGRFSFDMDERAAAILWRSSSSRKEGHSEPSTQDLIDAFRFSYPVHRMLKTFKIDGLLPADSDDDNGPLLHLSS
ncbi:MAG: hypothetical protein EPN75_05610 [Beijerinckiaceae bacterium]|nr:MAG: hypothetical protein EPN75_05610 [Beijerinckiaceae bacterium]